jgi:hypothetical protein
MEGNGRYCASTEDRLEGGMGVYQGYIGDFAGDEKQTDYVVEII